MIGSDQRRMRRQKDRRTMRVEDLTPSIIAAAKRSQQIRWSVYAELDNGSVHAIPIAQGIGEARLQAHLLFLAGRRAGQKQRTSEIAQTCLVSPAWLTRGTCYPRVELCPPESEPQEAVTLGFVLNSAPYHALIKLYQIIRDRRNEFTELVYLGEMVDPEELMALAFLAGWHSHALSNAEIRAKQPQGMRAFLVEKERLGHHSAGRS